MEEQTTSYDHGPSSPADPKVTQASNKRRIAQALNSRIRKKMGNIISNKPKSEEWLRKVPECPVFRPTLEEFQDPLAYIEKVQSEAQKWGICKIIPPVSPLVSGSMVCRELNGDSLKFTTRSQPVRERVWVDMDERKFNQTDTLYTLQQYCKLAEEFQRKMFFASGSFPAHMIESEYWRQRSITSDLTVEYGNDVEGTAFCSPGEGDPLGDTDWNLQVLPRLENSTLRLLKGEVPGITTPMLYIGMLYATFAWHVEDHYLYSINYQHLGAAKTWYGVPGCAADAFEEVAQKQVYARALQAEGKRGRDACDAAHKAILGKTTMFCPKLLLDAGVRVCRAVQQPGEFIVTFPRAYHAGFSNGFCVGEAVNFAMHDWYQFGQDCSLRYRRLKQPPILPHDELVCEEAMLLKERLMSGVAASSLAKPAADVSLAGTFVTLLRQENLQRRWLVLHRRLAQRPMPITSCDGMQTNDCSNCGHLCFLAMVMAKDKEEQRCMDCAMYDNLMGPDNKLFCHPKLDQYEDCARWFEQQPLLRDADWEGSVKDRGLTESEVHHAGWGHPNSRTVPPPNQEFIWESLPSATSCLEPETAAPELNIVHGVLDSDRAGHVALIQNTHSLDVSKLVLDPPAIDEGGLGVLLDAAACMELHQMAATRDAHGSAGSDSNCSVDVVNVSVARNAGGCSSDSADISCCSKEPTPTSTLESGAALAGRLPPGNTATRSSQPIMPAGRMAGQPGDAGADRGQPSATNADMAAQPGTGLAVAKDSAAPGSLNERPARGADEQSSSTSGGSSGAVMPLPSADPGPPAAEHAEAKEEAVSAEDLPIKAAAVTRDGQAAEDTPASKKTRKNPSRAPSKVDAGRGTDGPATPAVASGKKTCASGKETQTPAAYKFPSKVCEQAKRYYSGLGGSVRPVKRLSSDSVKVGGQAMSRQVYCLESDPSQRFMRIRDVAKAGDHLKSSAESARDVTRKLWSRATAKAQETTAAGGSAPEVQPYPRHYTCEEEPSINTTFLVGMDEVARVIYRVSDARQRRMLMKYCSSVWPELKQRCADESDEAKDGCKRKAEAGSKASKGSKGGKRQEVGRSTRQKRGTDTLKPDLMGVIALTRRDYAVLEDAPAGSAHLEAVVKYLAKRQRVK